MSSVVGGIRSRYKTYRSSHLKATSGSALARLSESINSRETSSGVTGADILAVRGRKTWKATPSVAIAKYARLELPSSDQRPATYLLSSSFALAKRIGSRATLNSKTKLPRRASIRPDRTNTDDPFVPT